ncbi:hypothetical protein DFP72DRAFT_1077524 [Ephemerocybe angulata]|uniref:Uncharacterized protein n=1 Tax=Ephemerocybe angulata TaxID=980116 RepID=A0A8H6LWK2_9AGAR|nr:hypothetical protein DFP72DRAFT_1077524 [Tulosesus angulatus]
MSSSFNFKHSRTSERPTLPSIHSLDLPFMNDSYEKTHSIRSMYPRKTSTSSSNTSMSRSPSPSPSVSTTSSRDSTMSPTKDTFPMHAGQQRKLRLVPCPFEEAEAIIVVPDTTSPSLAEGPRLLVGSAARAFRNPQRRVTKGARVHPYRISGVVSSTTTSRRSSMASMPPN